MPRDVFFLIHSRRTGIVPLIWPRPLPSVPLPVSYSLHNHTMLYILWPFTELFHRVWAIARKTPHNKIYEMHFHEFYSDDIIYMFRIGKLFIFRRQFYCTCSLWYSSIAASPHECIILTINCMYSKIAS